MTALEFLDIFTYYVAPVTLTIMLVLLVYIEVTEALITHRRAKREREQQIH